MTRTVLHGFCEFMPSNTFCVNCENSAFRVQWSEAVLCWRERDVPCSLREDESFYYFEEGA